MKNKKTLILIISICIGIILLSSSLAFFNFSTSNNNTVGQNSLANIEDTIKLEIDETYKKDGLVPIKEEYVTRAALQECVDDLGNPSCSMYKVKVSNTAQTAQKIHITLNIEQNTFENYRLLIYKGSKIKEPLMDPIILPKNELKQEKIEELTTTLLPEQSVIYNLVYYVNNIDDNTNDINQKFLASISVNTEVSGDYTGTGLGEPDDNPITVDLASGMVPIIYNEDNKWEITSISDPNWYNYEEQKWANAAVLTDSSYNVIGDTINVSEDEGTVNTYAMFVYVPRFSYTIGCTDSSTCLGYKIEGASDLAIATPGAIDIKFVDTDTKEDPGIANGTYPTYIYTSDETRETEIANWYTHPAFDFGGTPLSGIWVGKFETSVDTTSTCYTSMSTTSNCYASNATVMPRILPNVTSLRYQTVYNQFNTANKFTATDNIYGLTGDAHMMKNSEWSAVAYLSQSIYGKYGNASYTLTNKEIYKNDSSSYYTGRSLGSPSTASGEYSSSGTCYYDDITDRADGTGVCGAGASTTGNIYGIYDMSGGAHDRVMGNYGGNKGSAGFSSMPDTKYYDKFTTTSPFTTKQSDTIGYAFVEVSGWYGDNTSTYSDSYPWVSRGGYYNSSSYASAFYDYDDLGVASGSDSFRSCLVALP